MLTIVVPEKEMYDRKTNEFIYVKKHTLQLEHSLVSVSKWESKWKKPFLKDKPEKTDEEIRDYIRCMTLTQNVDPNVYKALTKENVEDIRAYINDEMTATVIYTRNNTKSQTFGKKKQKTYTSEEIYSWMIEIGIPFECQKWHLNRLLMLIRVCNINDVANKRNNPFAGFGGSGKGRAPKRPH